MPIDQISIDELIERNRRVFRKKHGTPEDPWHRFYEYLVVDCSTTMPGRANWEALALFEMIQYCFDGSGRGGAVKVSPYLLHNLSACCCVALDYNKTENIPWDTNEHDAILERTYNGFAETVTRAIKKGETRTVDGKVLYGHLKIPDWFVVWAKSKKVAAFAD